MNTQMDLTFNGSDYVPELDQQRLSGQILRIRELMIDGKYRTLSEIEQITNDPQSSISAQLRNLRKDRFGKHILNKRRVGNRRDGLFEYQLLKNELPIEKNFARKIAGFISTTMSHQKETQNIEAIENQILKSKMQTMYNEMEALKIIIEKRKSAFDFTEWEMIQKILK